MKQSFGIALIILASGSIGFFWKDPPKEPKKHVPDDYLVCLQTVSPDKVEHHCGEILASRYSSTVEKHKHAQFLAVEYQRHLDKCLAWKEEHPKMEDRFDGTNSCSLSAKLYLQNNLK